MDDSLEEKTADQAITTEETKVANTPFVSQITFDRHTQSTYLIMAGVIIVLFVAFLTLLFSLAALLVEAWDNRAPSYENLISQVQEQNIEIKNLTNEISTTTALRK